MDGVLRLIYVGTSGGRSSTKCCGMYVSSFLVYDLLTERSIVEFVSLGETVRYGSKEKECGKSVGGGDNLCS